MAAVLERAGAQRHSTLAAFTSRRKTMNWITSKALAGGRVAAVVTLTGVLLTAAGGSDRERVRIPRGT